MAESLKIHAENAFKRWFKITGLNSSLIAHTDIIIVLGIVVIMTPRP